ncbi:hypothetical protein I308_105776 [Cryptococcus tetragattii IND107]|uniref:Uncharacterized protein n=1 Tax=Cryptococcus tetragattii IND107 TaxID=1296105 RepID=A0ABR3BLQ0_9TREE
MAKGVSCHNVRRNFIMDKENAMLGRMGAAAWKPLRFGSITVKGNKAKGMQEEIGKNSALAKEMEMAATEEELEKERWDVTDRL